MDPPLDAIKTAEGTIWIEDGILFERANAVLSTADMVKEIFGRIDDLIEGVPRPFLWDIRDWPGGSPEWWLRSTENLDAAFTAVAVLTDRESDLEIGPLLEAIGMLMLPIESFTDEAEALAYLRRYLLVESALDPPNDAVETTTGAVWLKNGIIFDRSNDSLPTGETEAEDYATYRDLTGGVRAPLLWDARKWRGGDVATWTTSVAELESTLSAVAMLVEPGVSVPTGPFSFDRMPVPIRVFTDLTEALTFVREHMTS